MHNRRWSSEIHYWSSKNAHVHRAEKSTELKPTKDGFKIRGGGKGDYVKPKSISDVYDCLSNWRSAIHRLWPWDYSPEVFVRIMDEYSYGILAMQ